MDNENGGNVLKVERNIEERLGKKMDNKWNIGQGGNLPIGFGLSLAANEKSMQAFAGMSDAQKQEVVEKSRHMQTRADMEQFVNSLGEKYSGIL